MDQTINLITRIFSYAFLAYKTLLTFDNTTNYVCFIENALLIKKMNMDIGRK